MGMVVAPSPANLVGPVTVTGNETVTGTNAAGALSLSGGGGGLFGENAGGAVQLVRANAADANPGANVAKVYVRDGTVGGTLKLVVRAGAAGAETTILDNIPQ